MDDELRCFYGVKNFSVAVSFVSLLCGCSILNPHVTPENYIQTGTTTTEATKYAGDLDGAISYANSWRVAYYQAVGNDSLLRNGVALSLVPIGAVSLYRGITSTGGKNSIAALGLTGASIYGVGSYLESSPRQRVYLAGSQAIGCALLAVRPLLMYQTEYTTLVQNIGAVTRTMTAISLQIANVQALADAVRTEVPSQAVTLARADSTIAIANDLVANARTTIHSGNVFLKNVQQSGFTLRIAVD